MAAATPVPRAYRASAPETIDTAANSRGASTGLARALCTLGLVGVVVSVFVLAARAATSPSQFVPAHTGGWPSWMAGPLQGLGVGIGTPSFEVFTLLMCL